MIFQAVIGIATLTAIIVGLVKMKESESTGWKIIGVTLFVFWIISSIYNESGSGKYFSNCSDARAQGYGDIYQGEAGYRSELDRDGDGVACEW